MTSNVSEEDPEYMVEVYYPGRRSREGDQEESFRYVFISYSKSYDSDEVLKLGQLSPFEKEFWRQIVYRIATRQSEFKHAAIVVLKDDDYDNPGRVPSGEGWQGAYWDWGRRRVEGSRAVHPSGEARITGPKTWDRAEASEEALKFSGLTSLSDEDITARSRLPVKRG